MLADKWKVVLFTIHSVVHTNVESLKIIKCNSILQEVISFQFPTCIVSVFFRSNRGIAPHEFSPAASASRSGVGSSSPSLDCSSCSSDLFRHPASPPLPLTLAFVSPSRPSFPVLFCSPSARQGCSIQDYLKFLPVAVDCGSPLLLVLGSPGIIPSRDPRLGSLNPLMLSIGCKPP